MTAGELGYTAGYVLSGKAFGICAFFITRKIMEFTWPKTKMAFANISEATSASLRSIAFGKTALYGAISCLSLIYLFSSVLTIIKIPNLKKINLEYLADHGDPIEICGVASSYLYGINVNQDYVVAKKLLERSCEQGCPEAFSVLSFMYLTGHGVGIDVQKAISLLHSAAEMGYAPTQAELGVLYISGQYVEKDAKQGLHYLNLAAQKNNNNALFYLGCLHEEGNVVAHDIDQAKKYYTLAANQNHPKALSQLAVFSYKKGNYQEAEQLFEAAIKYENKRATENVFFANTQGLSSLQNSPKSILALMDSTDKANIVAFSYLGQMYADPKCTLKNYGKAKYYLEKAAKFNDHNALTSLGCLYIAGANGDRNIKEGMECLEKAAPMNKDAKTILASLNNPETKNSVINNIEKFFC